jgi:hypothetical protein
VFAKKREAPMQIELATPVTQKERRDEFFRV